MSVSGGRLSRNFLSSSVSSGVVVTVTVVVATGVTEVVVTGATEEIVEVDAISEGQNVISRLH